MTTAIPTWKLSFIRLPSPTFLRPSTNRSFLVLPNIRYRARMWLPVWLVMGWWKSENTLRRFYSSTAVRAPVVDFQITRMIIVVDNATFLCAILLWTSGGAERTCTGGYVPNYIPPRKNIPHLSERSVSNINVKSTQHNGWWLRSNDSVILISTYTIRSNAQRSQRGSQGNLWKRSPGRPFLQLNHVGCQENWFGVQGN